MNGRVQELGTFLVEVGGVPFRIRRRHTGLMLRIGDPRQVFGMIAGAIRATLAAEDDSEERLAKGMARHLEMLQRAAPLILVSADGVVYSEDNPVVWEEIAPVFDAIFSKFLESGLSVGPTPSSCEGTPELRPRPDLTP